MRCALIGPFAIIDILTFVVEALGLAGVIMSDFHIATDRDIREGKTSDIYFHRAMQVLRGERKDRTRVYAEVTTGDLPQGWPWAIFCGLDEVVRLFQGKEVDLWAVPEGTVFTARTLKGIPSPVMTIEGPYGDFCIYETPLLGFLCQASGIATKTARFRKLLDDRRLISFGVRRMHPGLVPMIERSAYIGGADGVTTPLGAALLNLEPAGTMPHALVIVLDGPRQAFEAFHKHIEKKVSRIALVDTFYDEKAEAMIACEVIPNIDGVRLDTPSSRRGNFASMVREVRWELDVRGYKDAKIYVSGGIDEAVVPSLVEAGVYGFGIGTSISNARAVDFALDIAEKEEKPVAKRGKFAGRKKLYRCEKDLSLEVNADKCPKCRGKMRMLHRQYLARGKLMAELPKPSQIRDYVLKQLKKVELNVQGP